MSAPSFSDYLKAAFNARPFGMLVPPNWVGLAAFGVLGVLNPGFWLIGGGLELAYLLGLSHNKRFRAVVDGKRLAATQSKDVEKTETLLKRLDTEKQKRFLAMRNKCREILDQQHMAQDSDTLAMQAGGLGRLLSIHMQLLLTQSAMEAMLTSADSDTEELERKISRLRQQAATFGTPGDLRKSLEGQVEILERRRKALSEGEQKLAFSESELSRIEQQAALIGDEVRLSSTPETVGSQIDRVSGELEETSRWIGEQQRLFGSDAAAVNVSILPSQTQ